MPVEVRAVKLFKQISTDDPRLHNLSAKQGVNLLKSDKTLRSQIVIKIREQLEDDIPADQLTKALGFSFEDIDANPHVDVVHSEYFYELQQKSSDRDLVIDSLLLESANLQTYKEDLLFYIISKKLAHNLMQLEDLTPEEKYIYEHKEAARLEKEKAQQEEAETRALNKQRDMMNNLDGEFAQYSNTIAL